MPKSRTSSQLQPHRERLPSGFFSGTRGAPPISPVDGQVRSRLRDLVALHVVRHELASLGPGKIDRALDIVVAADEARGAVLASFGLPRPALGHQLKLVLADEAGR